MGDDKSEVPQINYVAKDDFRKDCIRTETHIQNYQWPEYWTDILVEPYREMHREMAAGRKDSTLPLHKLAIKPEDFEPLEPPEKPKPFPMTTTQMYGWKVGNTLVTPANKWLPRMALRYMHKDLGWPEDHQW